MQSEIENALPMSFLQLRVLLWKECDIYVAQCLETGSIATADNTETLRSIVLELLTDEVDYNLGNEGGFQNLFSTPAPKEVWQRFYELSKNRNTDYVSGILMLDDSF